MKRNLMLSKCTVQQQKILPQICIGLHVEYPLFFSDFNETWILWTDIRIILTYQFSRKSVLWEPSCSMRTDRRDEADGRFSQLLRPRLNTCCVFRLLYKVVSGVGTRKHLYELGSWCTEKQHCLKRHCLKSLWFPVRCPIYLFIQHSRLSYSKTISL